MKQISLKGLVVAAMLASSLFITAPQALAEGLSRRSSPSPVTPSRKSPRIRLISRSVRPAPLLTPSRLVLRIIKS